MSSLIRNFVYFLEQLPPAVLSLMVAASVALISLLDYITGYDLSVSFIYLIPIVLTAWVLGKKPAILVSIVVSVLSSLMNLFSGQEVSSPFIPVWNILARSVVFITVVMLVVEVYALLEFTRNAAQTDPLTGVLTGREFKTRLRMELDRATRTGQDLMVLYLDLDDFKSINDSLGHEAGDELLKTVADTLSGTLRSSDMIGRLGGDEFGILLANTDEQGAREIVARLGTALREGMSGQDRQVTFSIGALACCGPLDDPQQLLREADSLMYEVKRQGKDGVIFRQFKG